MRLSSFTQPLSAVPACPYGRVKPPLLRQNAISGLNRSASIFLEAALVKLHSVPFLGTHDFQEDKQAGLQYSVY